MNANLIQIGPGQIEQIHAHLRAGHEIVLLTYYGPTHLLCNPGHVDYIRASSDGKGYRLGWPGKSSVYVSEGLRFVAPGFTLKPTRNRKRSKKACV